MQKNCTTCQSPFEVTDEDREFYKKFKVPETSMCFDCRLQRLMAFYNRRKLYRRKCDFSGKEIVSIFSPDKPFKVYSKEIWFSDQWDPMEYGRDFDFNRPFIEQFQKLMHEVPMNALALLGDNVNSEFTNDNYKLKNCYLVFDGEQGENCFYGETFANAKDSLDFLFLYQSELCFECTVCHNCYNLKYSQFCQTCSDSWFLKDCTSCKHCFGCVNLKQKQYYIFNKPYGKEEYENFIKNFQSGKHSAILEMKKKAKDLYLKKPVKAMRGVNNINVIGDNLSNSKNVFHCFDSNNLRDCRYLTDCLMGGKDSMDVYVWGNSMELCYNCCTVGDNIRNVIGSSVIIEGCSDIYHSYWCTRNCKNLLGCVGLRHKKYCILNKQYSKEEYEAIFPKIMEHMQKTEEWGEFFDSKISPFGYNETIAQDFYPLTKEQVLKNDWKWCDYEIPIQAKRSFLASRLPDNIKDISDEILTWAIICEKTGKPFKLIPQELKFYRTQNLPLPRRHPDVRHRDRLSLKNPFRLWNRKCQKCGKEIKTTYAPERLERVYCDKCYMNEVY